MLTNNLENDYHNLDDTTKRLVDRLESEGWAHHVTKESLPELWQASQSICKTLGITSNPDIIIYKGDKFDGAYHPACNAIFISSAEKEFLQNESFQYAIAHELGHLKHSRRQVIRLLSSWGLSAGTAGFAGSTHILTDDLKGLVTRFAATYIIVQKLQQAGLRISEREADRCAIDAIGADIVTKEMERCATEDKKAMPPTDVLEKLRRLIQRALIVRVSWEERLQDAKKYSKASQHDL